MTFKYKLVPTLRIATFPSQHSNYVTRRVGGYLSLPPHRTTSKIVLPNAHPTPISDRTFAGSLDTRHSADMGPLFNLQLPPSYQRWMPFVNLRPSTTVQPRVHPAEHGHLILKNLRTGVYRGSISLMGPATHEEPTRHWVITTGSVGLSLTRPE